MLNFLSQYSFPSCKLSYHVRKSSDINVMHHSLSILADSNNGNFILATFFFMTVKIAIGGFSMGAATALYSATCAAFGRYGNGNAYPINLRAVVGLSGWLPGSRYDHSELSFLNKPLCPAAITWMRDRLIHQLSKESIYTAQYLSAIISYVC